jgi:hypothetical protein
MWCPISFTARALRRHLTIGLLTSGLIVGTLFGTVKSADAASYVKGCFKYHKGGNLQGAPVQLQALNPQSGWFVIATVTLPVDGCVQWSVPSTYRGFRLKWEMSYRPPGMTGVLFFGRSPLEALPGNLRVDLGTGVVYCNGCR